MRLRHYPVFNGAPMAQEVCAVIDCALGETNGAMGAPLGFSNGASMAHTAQRRSVLPSLVATSGKLPETRKSIVHRHNTGADHAYSVRQRH